MLTKSLMADLTEEQIEIQNEKWFEEQNIHLVLGKEIEAIHTDAKEVVLEGGMKLTYTKLVYALGSESFL